MRFRVLAAAAFVLALAIIVVPASAAPKPSAGKGHSRPNCRALLSLAAIEAATGETLEFNEVGPDRFEGKPPQVTRAQSCDYNDPSRREYTVDPYAGYFKAGFEASPKQWNEIRSLAKTDSSDYGVGNINFKPMKTVDGVKLFSTGAAVPVLTPPGETGETSFIYGYTRLHNVFQVGLTNVPIATEATLIAGIAEGLDAEWLHGGRNG
jgi:hypothetical protein